MIVIGTYFVQTQQITEPVVLCGVVVGVLSSLVLFITSFPDHDADKAKEEKHLLLVLESKKHAQFYGYFLPLLMGYLSWLLFLKFFLFLV